MKTIISGGRHTTDYSILENAISVLPWKITEVISGMCKGVDKLGVRYAQENKLPLDKCYARWDKYGDSAGPIRNEVMAKKGEALLAIWDGKSTGTGGMIGLAKKYGLKIYIHKIGIKTIKLNRNI